MKVERLAFRGSDDGVLAADARGEGPTVLLLHGGGQTRHAWEGTAIALANHGFRAVAVDGRGHGDSDWDAAGRYQLEDFVRDLVALARQLDEPPFIVGASLGGSTAMLGVGRAELEARAVVLVDIAPRIEPRGVRRIYDFMTAHPDGFETLSQAADAVSGYLTHRRRPRSLDGLRKNLRRGADGRYRWHWDPRFLDIMEGGRSTDSLAERLQAARGLSLPTLLVRGKLSDLLAESGAREFLAACPHAEYVDVSGAAHMVAGDQNDRFSAAVVDFLCRHRDAERAAPSAASRHTMGTSGS